jgi:hypothetical protein
MRLAVIKNTITHIKGKMREYKLRNGNYESYLRQEMRLGVVEYQLKCEYPIAYMKYKKRCAMFQQRVWQQRAELQQA